MTQDQIQEYNKLCAEFLGAHARQFGASEEYELYGYLDCIEDGIDEKHFFMVDEMLFHSDWN